jgi:hypothetical protein
MNISLYQIIKYDKDSMQLVIYSMHSSLAEAVRGYDKLTLDSKNKDEYAITKAVTWLTEYKDISAVKDSERDGNK